MIFSVPTVWQERLFTTGADFLVTAIVTALIFLILISLHEFGHFIMAKSIGVPVLEFSVGMGPAIFKKQKGETLYSLRAFPVGGYCRLEGEDEASDSSKGFSNQKIWKRFLVLCAGAVFNLILGFLIFIAIVGIGKEYNSNIVSEVDERAYVSESGLMSGDKIISINGKRVSFYEDISLYTSEFSEGEDFSIEVLRNGEKLTFSSKPSVNITTYTYGEDYIEITDEINSVKETNKLEDQQIPPEYMGETATITRYIIGFVPKREEVTIFNIIPQAWNYSLFVTKNVYMAIFDLFTGRSGLDNVSGPVGVVKVVHDAVNSGVNSVINVLFIMAMLTINLGIFNLLPIPALDGGKIFFLLIELVRGKPVPPEKEGAVHTIGLILLLVLAVVIFFNDIMNIFA